MQSVTSFFSLVEKLNNSCLQRWLVKGGPKTVRDKDDDYAIRKVAPIDPAQTPPLKEERSDPARTPPLKEERSDHAQTHPLKGVRED